MSGAYPVFPLQLVVVVKYTTTTIRNNLPGYVTIMASGQFGHLPYP